MKKASVFGLHGKFDIVHILFISDNFPPEVNAPASRTLEHCSEWVKLGCEVTVLTCAPNFPKGKVFAGYQNKLWQVEQINGIKVCRVWSFITPNEGFLKRTLDYLSFMVTSFFAGLFIRKVDVIVGTSPQIFVTCSACLLAIIKRVPWVFELRDLWPASIKAVGAMNNKRILNILERIELYLYRRSSAIVSVTKSFKENLITRGIDKNKIYIVTNGVDLDNFKKQKKSEKLRSVYNAQNRFIVGYIGTIGLAHRLDIILELGRREKMKKSFLFLIIGEGADKKRLVAVKEKENLDNIIFVGSVEKNKIASYWSILDASIVHLKKVDLFKTVIPSKIFEGMSMGVPILLGVEGEAKHIIENTRSGLTFEPEKVEECERKLYQLYKDKKLQSKLAYNGTKAAQKYDRKELAKKMLLVINDVYVKKRK